MGNPGGSKEAEQSPSREAFQVTPIAYMILRRGNRILILKRAKTGMFSLPAGHMEDGERSLETAVREVEEEIGVKVEPSQAKFVHVGHFKDPIGERVAFFYECASWTGEPQLMEPHIHDETRWALIDNLPENMQPYVRRSLENIALQKPLTEYGWDQSS